MRKTMNQPNQPNQPNQTQPRKTQAELILERAAIASNTIGAVRDFYVEALAAAAQVVAERKQEGAKADQIIRMLTKQSSDSRDQVNELAKQFATLVAKVQSIFDYLESDETEAAKTVAHEILREYVDGDDDVGGKSERIEPDE